MSRYNEINKDITEILTENITISKAYRLRKLLKEMDAKNWIPIATMVLVIGAIVLIVSGMCVLGDYMGWSSQETDWESLGFVSFIMPCGMMLGYMIASETIFAPLKRKVAKTLDDKLEEIADTETDNSTETAIKPN